MNTALNYLFRLTVWFLLTADLRPGNVLLGIAVALLLPAPARSPVAWREGVRLFGAILLAIPRAYLQAFDLMLRPHRYSAITEQRVKARRTPGLIFLDIFLITFTPKTIVMRYRDEGWYEVHQLRRSRP